MVFAVMLAAEYRETPSVCPGMLHAGAVDILDILELDCAKLGWWKAVELRMSGIVGGKKDIGLFGSTGVVGMKKNCCVWGDIGVSPGNDIEPGMPGLGRLGSR